MFSLTISDKTKIPQWNSANHAAIVLYATTISSYGRVMLAEDVTIILLSVNSGKIRCCKHIFAVIIRFAWEPTKSWSSALRYSQLKSQTCLVSFPKTTAGLMLDTWEIRHRTCTRPSAAMEQDYHYSLRFFADNIGWISAVLNHQKFRLPTQ